MREMVKKTKLTENCSKETIRKFVDEILDQLTVEEKSESCLSITEEKLLDDLFVIGITM